MKYGEKPNKNYDPEEEIDYDALSDSNSVASATECTGLMYSPPENEFEAESYSDIYKIPKTPNKK